jgi:hypothetical protein
LADFFLQQPTGNIGSDVKIQWLGENIFWGKKSTS